MSRALHHLAHVELNRFQQILAASPKKFRENLYKSAGLSKKTPNTFSLRKRDDSGREAALQEALRSHKLDPEDAEEMVRNYLYTKRNLLSDALDFLQVPHEDGLTNENLDFIEELVPEKKDALDRHLSANHDRGDVDLYLTFLGAREQ